MMGERRVAQDSLFYEFSLEGHVPADHLLRSIDRFVDLTGARAHLSGFYSTTGRPSVDPELMIRMLIVGYCYGIRSERRLCEEVHLNLAYRCFCRLGLEREIPDHSTFSKNRHGRSSGRLYRRVLTARCAKLAPIKWATPRSPPCADCVENPTLIGVRSCAVDLRLRFRPLSSARRPAKGRGSALRAF